jgi:hypothetical protein
MADQFRRTEISRPGAAIRELKIELPQSIKEAISESLDRGKRAAEAEREMARSSKATFRRKVG